VAWRDVLRSKLPYEVATRRIDGLISELEKKLREIEE
jgi:hypothetical protein